MNKPALLIVNLGTPDSPSYFNVFKYLREFLMDGRVIDIPAFFRFILVTLIICPLRSFSSGKIYKQLWDLSGGESPLLKNTRELTNKLNEAQEKFNVFYAMRYQTPSIKNTLAHIQKTNPTDLIIFPLFPHYASATSGSVYAEVTKQLSKEWVIPNFNFISQYYDHPAFIEAWIKTAQNYDIEQYDKILFSYHGLPKSQVNKVYKDMQCDGKNCEHEINDDNHYCYTATVYETSKLIADRLNIPQDKYEVSFQSRLTNNWLEPFSDEVLKSYP
ncbi:ferrochelatase, partial [Gammaproteobacteria bacterium]|nr:ferrochelatase [Gammaproteobacteria bacterium]